MRGDRPLAAFLLFAAAALGCEGPLEAPLAKSSDATARGMYLPISPTTSRALSSPGLLDLDSPLPIYLHRHGGTYYGGQDDSRQNRSIVVGNGSATLSAFAGGDAMWGQLKQCVTDQFARFNAYVTDVEPLGGAYIEAVIGGTPQQVGLPNGVGGVAPIDTFQCNIIPNAIVYVFSGALPNSARVLCEVAAQEIAHALSLDHELLCTDPMTYLSGCGAKTFQDQAAQCGEFSPRQCDCGRPSQNSVQILYDKLGASDGTSPPPPAVDDQGPPSVAISSPANGAVLPPSSTISVVATASDDTGLASVELVWAHTGDVFPCPVVGQGYSCTQQNGGYVWRLNVGTGTRTFRVRARDVAGNVAETPAVTISLDQGGAAPPATSDVEPPEAALVSPADGAALPANSVIEIVATATDDVDVSDVHLLWDWSGDAFPCPTQQQAVSCTRQGSTYRWQVNVGAGERTFRVRARDAAGHATTTPARTVTLSDGPILPPDDDAYEDNDTWDTATPLPCSSGLDLRAAVGDVDWLMVSAAPGVEVTAQVRSLDGANLAVALTSGPRAADVLVEGESSGTLDLSVVADTSYVGIRVTTTGGAGDYRVVAGCAAPREDAPPPGDAGAPTLDDEPAFDVSGTPVERRPLDAASGCAATGGSEPWPAWLLATLLLVGRRRQRPACQRSLDAGGSPPP